MKNNMAKETETKSSDYNMVCNCGATLELEGLFPPDSNDSRISLLTLNNLKHKEIVLWSLLDKEIQDELNSLKFDTLVILTQYSLNSREYLGVIVPKTSHFITQLFLKGEK